MNGYWSVLAVAGIPAAAQVLGGWLAEPWNISKRLLSLALHAAAGIVLSVVAVGLLPEIVKVDRPWVVVLCFFAGGLLFVGLDTGTQIVSATLGQESGSAWVLFAGISIDVLSDGVLLGASATISPHLLFLLALGQAAADIPQAFSSIAALRRHGVQRRMRVLLSVAYALPLLVGATIGYFGVRGAPDLLKKAIVAFTAGFLATLVVEEIVPQAHDAAEVRWNTGIFVAAFAFYIWLSTFLA